MLDICVVKRQTFNRSPYMGDARAAWKTLLECRDQGVSWSGEKSDVPPEREELEPCQGGCGDLHKFICTLDSCKESLAADDHYCMTCHIQDVHPNEIAALGIASAEL